MSDTLLSTADAVGIRRQHWDNTGDSTADYFIDLMNDSNHFIVPALVIHQPFLISDSVSGFSIGTLDTTVSYEGDKSNLVWTINNWTSSTSTSGTDNDEISITGLAPGVYTLKVRDSTDTDIAVEATFEIFEQPDWSIKYNVQFRSIDNQLCYAQVYMKDYSGSQIDVLGTTSPVIIEHGNSSSEEKFSNIKGCQCTLNLLTDATTTNYNEFLTADDGEYYVRIQRAGQQLFKGYLLTENYSEQYAGGIYPISLIASDGLAKLKGIQFQSRTGEKFNNPRLSIYDLIRKAIQEISPLQNIKIRTFVPLHPENVTIGSSATILQTFVDCRAFYVGDNIPSWWDVLTSVLKPLGCRLFYAYDQWWVQYIQRVDGSVTVHKRNLPSAWSTESRDFRVDAGGITNEDVFWVHNDTVLRVDKTYRETKVSFDFSESLADSVPTPAFDETSWLSPLQAGQEPSHYLDNDGSFTALFGATPPYFLGIGNKSWLYRIGSWSTTGENRYYSKSVPVPLGISSGNLGSFYIRIKWQLINATSDGGTAHTWPFALIAAGQYLDIEGGWTALTIDGGGSDTATDDILINVPFTCDDSGKVEGTFEISTDELTWIEQQNPAVQIRFYHPSNVSGGAGVTLYIDEVEVKFLPDGEEVETIETTTKTSATAKKGTLDVELTHGNTDIINAQNMVRGQYFYEDIDDGSVENWEQTGKIGAFDLQNILATRISSEYASPKKILNGTLHGNFEFYELLIIDSDQYIQDRHTYDVMADDHNVILIELDNKIVWPT